MLSVEKRDFRRYIWLKRASQERKYRNQPRNWFRIGCYIVSSVGKVLVKIYNYGSATYNGTTFDSGYDGSIRKNVATVDLGTITSDTNADITIGEGNAGAGYDTIYESADSYVYGEKEYIGANGSAVSDASSANVQLNSGNSYSNVWTGLQTADADGKEYSYHVEEDPISGFTTTYSDNNAAGIQTGALTVYNTQTETPKGSLWIQKTGKFNGDADSDGKLNDDYTFKVKDSDGNVVKTVTVTLTNGVITAVSGDGVILEDGKAKVSDLPEGTYTVTEDLTGKDGISLLGDNNVQVEVTADGTADTRTATFVNNKPYIEQALSVTKSITTTDDKWPKDQTFAFELAQTSGPEGGATLPTDKTATATEANQTATFGNIAFTKAGTYTFTITEQKPGDAPSYITYDTTPKTVTVKVEDKDNDGKLSVTSVDYAGEKNLTVTNTYSATGSATIAADKTFTNGTIGENQFSFSLQKLNADGSADGAAETLVVNKDTGKASKNITYDTAGTYTYKLKEVLPGDPEPTVTDDDKAAGYKIIDGIKYDLTEYTIVDTVTDNGDGTLSVSRTVAKNSEAAAEKSTTESVATFTNEQLGSLKLTKAVTVNGAATSTTLVDGTYTFTVAKGEESKEVKITIVNGAVSSATVDDNDVTLVEDGGVKYVELTNLSLGDYTITETDPQNGTVISNVKVDGDDQTATNNAVTVNVTATEKSVVFINNLTIFEFRKTWKDSTLTAIDWPTNTPLTFTVTATSKTNDQDTRTYTVTANPDDTGSIDVKEGTATASGITGTIAKNEETTVYSIILSGLSSEYSYKVTAEDDVTGYTKEVTDTAVTNTELQTFNFTKAWANNDSTNTWPDGKALTFDLVSSDSTVEYTVVVTKTNDADNPYSVAFTPKTVPEGFTNTPTGTVTQSDSGYGISFTGLPAGKTYTLTETKVDGYEEPNYGERNTSAGNNGTVTNTELAKFEFTKQWQNSEGNALQNWPEGVNELTFTLKDSDNAAYTVTVTKAEDGTFTASVTPPAGSTYTPAATVTVSGNSGSVSVTGLPAGKTYTLTENPLTEYDTTYANSDNSDAVNGISTGGTVTNKEKPETFEFGKVWANNDGSDWKKDITVTLTGTDKDGNTISAKYIISKAEDGSFTVTKTSDATNSTRLPETGSRDGEDGYKFKFENLPSGYTYTLTEDKVDGYEEPAYSNTDATDVTDKAEDGGTITNTELGTFEFTKVWADQFGNPVSWHKDGDADTELTFTITGKKEKAEDKTYTIKVTSSTVTFDQAVDGVTGSIKDGKVTINGLPSGYTFTVKETSDPISGYDAPDYGKKDDGTAKEAAENNGTIINKQTATYSLPATGGPGIIGYIGGGLLLMLFALLLLYINKSHERRQRLS